MIAPVAKVSRKFVPRSSKISKSSGPIVSKEAVEDIPFITLKSSDIKAEESASDDDDIPFPTGKRLPSGRPKKLSQLPLRSSSPDTGTASVKDVDSNFQVIFDQKRKGSVPKSQNNSDIVKDPSTFAQVTNPTQTRSMAATADSNKRLKTKSNVFSGSNSEEGDVDPLLTNKKSTALQATKHFITKTKTTGNAAGNAKFVDNMTGNSNYILPRCFGTMHDHTELVGSAYEFYTLYLKKSPTGIGLLLQNIDDRAVVCGISKFLPRFVDASELPNSTVDPDEEERECQRRQHQLKTIRVYDVIVSVDSIDVRMMPPGVGAYPTAQFDRIIHSLRWRVEQNDVANSNNHHNSDRMATKYDEIEDVVCIVFARPVSYVSSIMKAHNSR